MSQEPTTLLLSRPPDFITSDTHLGHANILDYCPGRRQWRVTDGGRPVANIHDHDAAILGRWAATVRPGNVVLHLGDFAFGSPEKLRFYAQRLTGVTVLCVGNHDRSMPSMREIGFSQVARRVMFHHPLVGRVVCRHRPKDFTADDTLHTEVLLHGHCHGDTHRSADGTGAASEEKLYDVGVDVFGPGPLRLGSLIQEILCENRFEP